MDSMIFVTRTQFQLSSMSRIGAICRLIDSELMRLRITHANENDVALPGKIQIGAGADAILVRETVVPQINVDAKEKAGAVVFIEEVANRFRRLLVSIIVWCELLKNIVDQGLCACCPS